MSFKDRWVSANPIARIMCYASIGLLVVALVQAVF